jgi:peptide deformylase
MNMSQAARYKIIALPNPHLRQRSKKVGFISKDILKIVEEMKVATLDWEASRKYEVGVALAAVQLDQLYKIVVIRDDFEAKDNKNFTVFINPVITKYEGQQVEDYEGCLSIKDIYGRVPRFEKVRVKAADINGKEFRVTATGFLARVFQHEIDHTNGVLFIDHIKDTSDAFFTLDDSGQLKEINYDSQIKDSDILW